MLCTLARCKVSFGLHTRVGHTSGWLARSTRRRLDLTTRRGPLLFARTVKTRTNWTQSLKSAMVTGSRLLIGTSGVGCLAYLTLADTAYEPQIMKQARWNLNTCARNTRAIVTMGVIAADYKYTWYQLPQLKKKKKQKNCMSAF